MAGGLVAIVLALGLTSPNGLVSFELDRNSSGGLIYTVRLGADIVVEPSALGIVVDGHNLGEGVEIGRAQGYAVDERYPWYGVHATAVNRCRGSRVTLTQKAARSTWTLDARACDDGAAFRYIVPGAVGAPLRRAVVRDTSDDAAAVVVEHTGAAAGAPLTIELRAAGGFIARLMPKD